MKAKRNLALVASGLVFALSSGPAAAITIGFSPVSQTVPLGSNPQVDILATLGSPGAGGSTPDLGGWDLVLNFDPSIVTLDSVAFGTSLAPSMTLVSPGPPGTVRLQELSLVVPVPPQPTDGFTLATLTFSADAVGTTLLSFDPQLVDLTTGNADPITIYQLDTGSITVRDPGQQVPDGGNLTIVALPALLGLLVWAGRRSSR